MAKGPKSYPIPPKVPDTYPPKKISVKTPKIAPKGKGGRAY